MQYVEDVTYTWTLTASDLPVDGPPVAEGTATGYGNAVAAGTDAFTLALVDSGEEVFVVDTATGYERDQAWTEWTLRDLVRFTLVVAEVVEPREYHVVWAIEVIATSAAEAARQALAIQRDPSSVATVFHVVELGGFDQVRVDVEDL